MHCSQLSISLHVRKYPETAVTAFSNTTVSKIKLNFVAAISNGLRDRQSPTVYHEILDTFYIVLNVKIGQVERGSIELVIKIFPLT